MFEFLKKYMLLLFLLANLTAEYAYLAAASKYLFYGVLALSVPVCLVNINTIRNGIRMCPYIGVLTAIYWLYQFTVGIDTIDTDNIIYLIAKTATFFIMLLSISSNFEFYFKASVKPLGYIITALLVIGYSYISYSGGRSYGFYNANAGCAIAAIGVSCFLFQSEKLKWYELMCLLICIFCVVTGHSRNSLAIFLIIILFRYGISGKMIAAGLAGIIALVVAANVFEVELESVDRVVGTIKGEVALDREDEREAAMWMINQHKFDGNGFNSELYGEAALMTNLGAHNGYLSTLQAMGYLFGGLWIVVVVIGCLKLLKIVKYSDLNVRRNIAVVFAILFAAMNESFLPGVNQIVTNLFFVSFTIATICRYRINNDIPLYEEGDILR